MSLNIKAFINILLIILILSIVLNNVGLNIVIGRPSPFDVKQSDYPVGSMLENFEDSDARAALEKYADELVGLNGDEGEQKSAKRGLSSKSARRSAERRKDRDVKIEAKVAAQKNVEEFTDAFPQMPVKPGNFFGLNDNSANFGSNVMDINKFYSNSFGDIEFKTPYTGNAGAGQLSASQQQAPTASQQAPTARQMLDGGSPRLDSKTGNGTATYKPDMWQYKSELVMNGGNLFGSVSGFDGMDGGLAAYDGVTKSTESETWGAPVMSASCKGGDMSGCAVGNDDLRMGMGIPGRTQRFTQ